MQSLVVTNYDPSHSPTCSVYSDHSLSTIVAHNMFEGEPRLSSLTFLYMVLAQYHTLSSCVQSQHWSGPGQRSDTSHSPECETAAHLVALVTAPQLHPLVWI